MTRCCGRERDRVGHRVGVSCPLQHLDVVGPIPEGDGIALIDSQVIAQHRQTRVLGDPLGTDLQHRLAGGGDVDLVGHPDTGGTGGKLLNGQAGVTSHHLEAVPVEDLVEVQGRHVGGVARVVGEGRQLCVATLGRKCETVVLNRQEAGAGSSSKETVGELIRHGSRHQLAEEHRVGLEIPTNGAVGAQCPPAQVVPPFLNAVDLPGGDRHHRHPDLLGSTDGITGTRADGALRGQQGPVEICRDEHTARLSGCQDLLDDNGESVVDARRCPQIGNGDGLRLRTTHRVGSPSPLQHLDIIGTIAQGDDVGAVLSEDLADVLQATGLGDTGGSGLGHRESRPGGVDSRGVEEPGPLVDLGCGEARVHDHELDGLGGTQFVATDEDMLSGVVLGLERRDDVVIPVLNEEDRGVPDLRAEDCTRDLGGEPIDVSPDGRGRHRLGEEGRTGGQVHPNGTVADQGVLTENRTEDS